MLRPQIGVLANKNGGGIKTVYCLHSRQFGGFQMWPHALGLCNMPATFQRRMQICLSELNLIYCLIYLDDIIIFSQMVEEHLHRLHVVFDHFKEYNLKLKPSNCSLFKEEINYLAHWVSKEGVWPSDSNLKAITECALPGTYMEVHACLSLVAHYQWFIRDFACITQLLNKHVAGEEASRKSE